MGAVIESHVKHSLGDSNYGRAVEGLRVLREELTAYEEPRLYNTYVRALKAKLLSGKLDGDRQEMWWLVRRHRLGLVTWRESDLSAVEDDEANTVGYFFGFRWEYRDMGMEKMGAGWVEGLWGR